MVAAGPDLTRDLGQETSRIEDTWEYIPAADLRPVAPGERDGEAETRTGERDDQQVWVRFKSASAHETKSL